MIQGNALTATAPKAPAPALPPTAQPGTKLLELALYSRYMKNRFLFEKGKVYKVTNEQAVILLGEEDGGRSIWRIWRKPVPKPTVAQVQQDGTVNATALDITSVPVDEFSGGPAPKHEISIGNDEEIADILAGIEVEV